MILTPYEILNVAVPVVLAVIGAAWLVYRYMDTRITNQITEVRAQIEKCQARVATCETTIARLEAGAITGEHLEKSIDKIEALLTRELSGLREELRQAHSRLDWFVSHINTNGKSRPSNDG